MKGDATALQTGVGLPATSILEHAMRNVMLIQDAMVRRVVSVCYVLRTQ